VRWWRTGWTRRTRVTGEHGTLKTVTALDALLSDPAHTGVWTLAPDRSSVTFRCRSFWGLLPVKGRFTEVRGEGQLGGASASGRLDITAASLDTGNRKRDDHLRSEDFFAVVRFPALSVVVTALQQAGVRAHVRGTLTVRGVTRPLELPAEITRLGDGAVQIAATAVVDRTDFEVDGNLLGMVKTDTTVAATAVFVKSG
jgi:polyisoprenoid-binding protein YceI